MDPAGVYKKTEKGEEEIRSRNYALSANLRRILILVNGSSTVKKLQEKGAGLPDITGALAELENQGFIQAIGGNPVARIKDELIAAAQQTLGDDAEKVVNKLREAPDTREEIEKAVSSCKKLVKLAIDEAKAEELARKCAGIIEHYKL